MKFRGYQEEDYEDLTSRIEDGACRLLFEGSVGYGKSLIIERLAHEYADHGEPVLVLSNRRAVVDQLRKRAAGKSRITTSTVQGIVRRIDRITAPALILIDEAHMGGAAAQYRRVLDAFPDAVVVGFTGTPTPDLFDILPEHVPGRTPAWLTERGFLAPLRYVCPSRPELNAVRIRKGEYDPAQLLDAMNAKDICGDAIQSYRRWCAGRPTLLFAIHVKHAEAVADEFRAAGIACEVLTGKDSADETERKIAWIRDGGLLIAVDKVSAGFDMPDLHAIISLRPTKSPQLWVQQMGRVARVKADGGPGLVIDHSGNAMRLGTLTMSRDWREKDPDADPDRQTEDGESLDVRQCSECMFIWDTGGHECPACGHDNGRDQRISKREKIRLDEIEAAEIERAHRAAKEAEARQRKSEEAQCETLEDWIKLAKVRGYKTAWAYKRHGIRQKQGRGGRRRPSVGTDGWPLDG
jgi:superfamily II DNA or RNA helicase